MPQVHGAAQHPSALLKLGGDDGERLGVLVGRDDEPGPAERGTIGSGRPAEDVGLRRHAPPAGDAAALVEADPAGFVLAYGLSRAQLGQQDARVRAVSPCSGRDPFLLLPASFIP